MSSTSLNQESINKLRQLVNEGVSVLSEVEVLNGGLNDTIKAIGDQLEIKPSILKKAIKIAYKQGLQTMNDDHAILNDVLAAVGKGD